MKPGKAGDRLGNPACRSCSASTASNGGEVERRYDDARKWDQLATAFLITRHVDCVVCETFPRDLERELCSARSDGHRFQIAEERGKAPEFFLLAIILDVLVTLSALDPLTHQDSTNFGCCQDTVFVAERQQIVACPIEIIGLNRVATFRRD